MSDSHSRYERHLTHARNMSDEADNLRSHLLQCGDVYKLHANIELYVYWSSPHQQSAGRNTSASSVVIRLSLPTRHIATVLLCTHK